MHTLEKHIFLIGFMGVGKSSTARALSEQLRVAEMDTDEMIAGREGMTISQIFQEHGEEYFRGKETQLLDELAGKDPCIVSCGGGMAMRPENIAKMKETGEIILLTAQPETIFEHVRCSTARPLLQGHMNVEYIAKLMGEREPRYQKAADWTLVSDDITPWEMAEAIVRHLEG